MLQSPAEPRAVEMHPPSDWMDGLCKTELGEATGHWEELGRGNEERADTGKGLLWTGTKEKGDRYLEWRNSV